MSAERLHGSSRASRLDEMLRARPGWVLAVWLLLVVALNAPTLLRQPLASGDEAWEMNVFWVTSAVDPSASGLAAFPDPVLWYGGLHGLSLALAFRLVGLGLYQARFVSLLWGALLLLLTYLAGRRIFGAATGLVAALLLGSSLPFFVTSHFVRPDIFVAAAVMASLWLASAPAAEKPPWRDALAGSCLALGVEAHPVAVCYLPLLALMYVSTGARRPAALFAAGLAFGALAYLALHVFPDPAAYLATFHYELGMESRVPLGAERLPLILEHELARYRSIFDDRWAELWLLLAALVAVAWRRQAQDLRLLGGALGAILLLGLLAASKSSFYIITLYPLLMLLLAKLVVDLLTRLRLPALQATPVIVPLLLVLGLQSGTLGALSDSERRADLSEVTARLRSVVPEGASVAGAPLYWLAFPDHRYTELAWSPHRARITRDLDLPEFLQLLRPDFLVLDERLDKYFYAEPDGVVVYRVEGASPSDYRVRPDHAVRLQGLSVLRIRPVGYGELSVYRLTWDSSVQ